MSRISSLTDTIGLSSPHSCCGPIGAGSAGAPDEDGGAADFEDEQAGIQTEMTRTRQDAQAILALVPVPPFTRTPITSRPSPDPAAASAADCRDRAARPSRAS